MVDVRGQVALGRSLDVITMSSSSSSLAACRTTFAKKKLSTARLHIGHDSDDVDDNRDDDSDHDDDDES